MRGENIQRKRPQEKNLVARERGNLELDVGNRTAEAEAREH
jgi:hypothetical protein